MLCLCDQRNLYYGTNYDETYVSKDLTIGKRAITITADVQSKVYGDTDPGLTAQVTSGVVQGSDVATGSQVRVVRMLVLMRSTKELILTEQTMTRRM
jgi:hypothetical protein